MVAVSLLMQTPWHLHFQGSTNQSVEVSPTSPVEMESASPSVLCVTIKTLTTVEMEVTWRKIWQAAKVSLCKNKTKRKPQSAKIHFHHFIILIKLWLVIRSAFIHWTPAPDFYTNPVLGESANPCWWEVYELQCNTQQSEAGVSNR